MLCEVLYKFLLLKLKNSHINIQNLNVDKIELGIQ